MKLLCFRLRASPTSQGRLRQLIIQAHSSYSQARLPLWIHVHERIHVWIWLFPCLTHSKSERHEGGQGNQCGGLGSGWLLGKWALCNPGTAGCQLFLSFWLYDGAASLKCSRWYFIQWQRSRETVTSHSYTALMYPNKQVIISPVLPRLFLLSWQTDVRVLQCLVKSML